MLFNEPKLLKYHNIRTILNKIISFSALQRAEIAEIVMAKRRNIALPRVSVLFNEPKLLKFINSLVDVWNGWSFSALQRAEIAEIDFLRVAGVVLPGFSALQRAEIAEMVRGWLLLYDDVGFQCSSTSRNC